MIIHFINKPEVSQNGYTWEVGFTSEDKRHIAILWEQGGRHYVQTGSKVTHDLEIFWLTHSQEQELYNMAQSKDSTREYLHSLWSKQYFSFNGLTAVQFRRKDFQQNAISLSGGEKWILIIIVIPKAF